MMRFGVSPPGARRWAPLARLAAPLALVTALDPASAYATAQRALAGATTERLAAHAAAAGNRVDGLSVEEVDDGTTTLRLVGTAKPTFNVYRLQDPERLVVDIAASERGKVVPHLPLDTWACGRLTIDDVTEQDAKLVRLVVELKRESSYIVVPDDNELVVTITPRQVPPEAYFARKSASARRAEIEAAERDAARLRKDAAALHANAKTKSDEAESRALAAQKEMKAASERAKSALAAETRARDAESRAQSAESTARKTLEESKNNKFRARRALRSAERERAKAEAARAEAESARAEAERELVVAKREAETERAAAAAAHARADAKEAAADRKLSAAELAAKEKLSEADGAAKRKLSAAELAAREKLSEADGAAKKKLSAAELAAREKLSEADGAAKKKLSAAELAAKEKLSAADGAAKKRLAEADGAAKQKLTEAERRLAEADGAAKKKLTEAERRLAEADGAAKKKLTEAERRLAEADGAAKQKMTEAERRLAEADGAAKKKLTEAERRLAEADGAAKKKLTEAERAAQDKLVKAEDAEVRAQARLAAAETAAAAAQREAAKLRSTASEADLSAKRKLADAEKKLDAAEKKLADAQRDATSAKGAAESARTRAETAERAATARLVEAERTKAAAQEILARAEAQAKKTVADAKVQADRTVADARVRAQTEASAKLDAAQREAKRLVDEAEAKAERKSNERVAAAEAAAAAKIATAEREARALAKSKLGEAELEAEKKLAAAKKEAKRRADAEVEAARKQAVVDAERELANIRASAKSETAALVAAARADAKRSADADVAKARAKAETAAAAEVARATAKAKEIEKTASDRLLAAEADRVAAARERAGVQADRKAAAAAKAEALALREEAESALAKAKTAMTDAGDERKHAVASRKEAERELATAKAEAAKAERRGEHDAALARRVAEAEAARDAAKAKQQRAEEDLRRLTTDREQLAAKLASERRSSETLRGTIAKRERDLGAAQTQVDIAREKLAALGETVSVAELERAKAETRKVQATATVLDKQVARLRSDADAAKSRADAAERKVKDLEAAGARRKKLEAARADADAAQADAKTARDELASSKKRLASVETDLETRKAEVDRLSERRTVLEREGKDLAKKNEAAKTELAKAEGKLADLERSLGTERDRLKSIEDEVRKAQTKLDDRLGEIAARSVPEPVAAPATKPASESTRHAAKAPAAKGKPAKVKDVRFEDDRDESRVIVVFDGALEYAGNSLTPTIQVLELERVKIPASLERSLDATAYKGPVKLVTSFAEDDDAKVVVSTTQPTKPRLEELPGQLVWHFPRKGAKGKATDAVSMAGTRVASAKATSLAAKHPIAQLAAPRNAPLAAVAPPGDSDLQFDSTPTRTTSRRGKWRGERIDIELQDAPMKDVLLLFSDIGKVNIISGRNVEGSVSMKLSRVPWDQALDIILRSQGLGYTVDGNVYRVATVEDLESERKAAIEAANARVQQKPLETKLVPVSYATVDEMIPKVTSVLSPRGSVTPDTRTNQLIIMDVAENIALAEMLIARLDTQTPQVLIEARIVEARTTFARSLGVQWGFDYIASPGTGNPTGLLFPNSVGIGGGATGRPPDTRGLILPAAAANPNYAVDLPIPVGTGTGGAIGFSFGSLSGNLNTNLRLSASESTGEIRIISAPKIVTLDNNEAQIEQGVQIPISQVSAQGVNTRFVRATLSLTVTPHVTNEGAVLLDVAVEKNEADFVNTGARGDPTILTKQARSRMLINDSDTAVIGGIYTRTKAVNFDKIPWIADVPIIGWFFKQKAEADQRSEVLIFLTPKIVNRASSIGG